MGDEERAVDISQVQPNSRPPRDNLVRSAARPEMRDVNGFALPVLSGHLAVFNEWTEIDSMWEGRFMERLAPGSFKKTISESKAHMKVTFNHGTDPALGDKVLGPIEVLKEDADGVYYEVPLFDTSYNRDLEPGLRAGVYGASFRFRVMKEDVVPRPQPSDYNPEGLPERTIREVSMAEFGPVTFPAYASATAGVRSLTDDYIMRSMARDPERFRELERSIMADEPAALLPDGAEATPHSEEDGSRVEASQDQDDSARAADEARDTVIVVVDVDAGDGGDGEADGCGCPNCVDPSCECPPCLDPTGPGADMSANADCQCASCSGGGKTTRSEDADEATTEDTQATEVPERKEGNMITINERRARLVEIQSRLQEIHAEFGASELPYEIRSEWDNLVSERAEAQRAITDYEARMVQVDEQVRAGNVERAVTDVTSSPATSSNRTGPKPPSNIYAVEEYRERAGGDTGTLRRLFRDGAMRAVEDARFAHPKADTPKAQGHVAKLLDTVDTEDSALARRILVSGSPTYQRAFGKTLKGSPLSSEEQRALSLGSDADGGFAVPFQLDPTVILTSDGTVNPLRAISRVEQIVGKEWQGVTSTGIIAAYADEAVQASDNSFSLVQPKVAAVRAQGFVPFSVEIGQDWGALQSEVARMLADAKDILEGEKFFSGAGAISNEPEGIIAGMDVGSKIETAGSNAFAVGDIYALEDALPPRFRARAQFVSNRAQYNRVRQFDTYGGASLWVRLIDGLGSELIGYPAKEASAMDAGLTDGEKILLFGDFNNFLIVDRIGMSVELIPHLFGANGRPTGQRGIYAIWRNSSVILADTAFRYLAIKA